MLKTKYDIIVNNKDQSTANYLPFYIVYSNKLLKNPYSY